MYKLDVFGAIVRLSDGAFIPYDENNADYRAYLDWLGAGFDPVEPAPYELAPVTRQAIARRRYEAETGGMLVNGLPVDTGRDSQALITGAAVSAMLDPAYVVRWKTGSGFVELDAQQIIGMASAVRSHVQACFNRESELVAALEEGIYTEAMLELGWPV